MSKKKNTLKDLDEFLKQQAATLVPPTKLNVPVRETETAQPVEVNPSSSPSASLDYEEILEFLKEESEKDNATFRARFYNLILDVMKTQHYQRPEDKILINTALYLKHGPNWKEAIRSYWKDNG